MSLNVCIFQVPNSVLQLNAKGSRVEGYDYKDDSRANGMIHNIYHSNDRKVQLSNYSIKSYYISEFQGHLRN